VSPITTSLEHYRLPCAQCNLVLCLHRHAYPLMYPCELEWPTCPHAQRRYSPKLVNRRDKTRNMYSTAKCQLWFCWSANLTNILHIYIHTKMCGTRKKLSS
jgi:hypothetical protein